MCIFFQLSFDELDFAYQRLTSCVWTQFRGVNSVFIAIQHFVYYYICTTQNSDLLNTYIPTSTIPPGTHLKWVGLPI